MLKELTVTKRSAYFGDESNSEFLNVAKLRKSNNDDGYSTTCTVLHCV